MVQDKYIIYAYMKIIITKQQNKIYFFLYVEDHKYIHSIVGYSTENHYDQIYRLGLVIKNDSYVEN